MIRLLLAGALVLALASAGLAQLLPLPLSPRDRAIQDHALSPAEMLAGLASPQAPGSVAGAATKSADDAKPDDAKKAAAAKADPASSAKPAAKPAVTKTAATRNRDWLQQCLSSWDAATHMTRADWSRVCRQIVAERARQEAEQSGK